MKIKVNYSTTYTYNKIVPKLIQCLKLYPTVSSNQQIINWKVKASKGKVFESHIDANALSVLK